jgi:chromosome segregation ATPase
MSCVTRCIFRWGLISTLALGGATLLIGPERVGAGLAHVRAKAQSVIDGAMDNPVALRRQLVALAEEYPQRIARVQGEIAEVNHQIGQFDRDSEVATRVVAMTTEDLGELKTLITRAQEVEGRPVYVRFEGVRFGVDQAYSEARRIQSVRTSYGDRLACNRQQLEVLTLQKTRLVEILTKLEDEFSTFETQMWQLDRQIDAIERNGRLIEMTEQLHATLEGYDHWGKLDNLKQLQAKMAELQAIQDAQLQTMAKAGIRYDYEKRAKVELDGINEPVNDDPFGNLYEDTNTDVEAETADDDSFAWLGPVVVE